MAPTLYFSKASAKIEQKNETAKSFLRNFQNLYFRVVCRAAESGENGVHRVGNLENSSYLCSPRGSAAGFELNLRLQTEYYATPRSVARSLPPQKEYRAGKNHRT